MEPSLAAAYKDLTGDVGFFLGFGRGLDNGDEEWDTHQQASIDRCVKGGLRNFYYSGYDWSFLKPIATLSLASGATEVDLPADYGGMEGRLIITTEGGQWEPLDFSAVGKVHEQQARYPDTTGWPELVAIEPKKKITRNNASRFKLQIWPTSDQAYSLKVQYYVNPDYLSGSFPYAYGGPMHAEALLESCLAVAEKLLDDSATVHAAEFDRRIQVSMDLDRRNKPTNLGLNLDRSDSRHQTWRDRHGWPTAITFDGTEYPG